ncbi:hypothetical protein BDV96DRAFT_14127 [Lophiotrema nucula]|uniref:Uncharacterized protein n=1 Tax=Lophiotrema nucula TaxID=690887 RepID=A0A6A5ZUA3_9PLEO|nr:hypothetical protein BDV96DRAFT_14127 [Lophiotrema nucula]
MRSVLAWLLFIQMGLSKPYPNSNNIESRHPIQGEEPSPEHPTVPSDQDAPLLNPNDNSHSKWPEIRDNLPSDTKNYTVWVTDRENESQNNETREWLKGLHKGKSKMNERWSFTWNKAEDVPNKELKKLWDEGRFDQEIGNYQRLLGWSNVVLDPAGYDTVSKRADWIKGIEAELPMAEMRFLDNSRILAPDTKIPRALLPRKFEWGDWDKQADAYPDLVQEGRYP